MLANFERELEEREAASVSTLKHEVASVGINTGTIEGKA